MIMPREDAAVLIAGMSGFAQEVFAAVSLFYKPFHGQRVAFLVEPGHPLAGTQHGQFHVVAEDASEQFVQGRVVDVYVAIARPDTKRKIVEKVEVCFGERVQFPQLVVPGSSIMAQTELGRGSMILPGCVLTVGIHIGEFSCINVGSSISHSAVIGDYCIINPGSRICGDVVIGSAVYLGASVTVLPGSAICDNVVVGAGAVVVHPITEPGTYAGTPARRVGDAPGQRIRRVSLARPN